MSTDNLPVVSAQELRENAHAAKALVAVDGLVYDLTDFLPSHPGGEDIVFPHLGTDVSAVFRGEAHVGDHQHSNSAVEMLQQYCVGRLEAGDSNNLNGGSGGVRAYGKYAATTTGSDAKSGKVASSSNRGPGAAGASSATFSGAHKSNPGDKTSLDLSKPLVMQVASLGRNYNDYVHRPQHLKQPARFFANNFLEFCSRTPWYVIPAIWWPVVCLEYMYTRSAYDMDHTTALLAWAYGVLCWSLLEYTLHRFLFHISEDFVHLSKFTITLHFLIHGCHHLLPMDRMRLVFPPVPAAIIMVFVYAGFYAIFGVRYALVMLAGATFGYTLYDLTHYYLHHGVPATEYFRSMKSYHLAHHYKNSIVGFGISSKLWDIVFNTELK